MSFLVAALVLCAGLGIGACGTLLDIQPDTTAPDASPGDATKSDAPSDASANDAPDQGTVGDAGGDANVSCVGEEAGTTCQADGAVCLSDSTCGACLGTTGTCHASGECCNKRCEPFSGATVGTCSGNCAPVGTSCVNQACCLPFKCTDAGTSSICVL
jgi:hypothetical protein